MDRRTNSRRARRVQVSFWRPGDEHVYNGYSTNFSRNGMFIGTNSPLPRGTRVRVEVNHASSGFVIEGVVARAVKMPPGFQSTGLSGMGIRFLSVEELVASLFPEDAGSPTAAPTAAAGGRSATENPPAPRQRPVVNDSRGALAPGFGAGTASPGVVAAPEDGTFRVTFRDLDDFAGVLRRDLLGGGVFVPTPNPPPMHSRIVVEIVPPLPGERPIRLLATVVVRQEPAGLDDGARPAGVAVAFADPEAATKALQPLAQKLQA